MAHVIFLTAMLVLTSFVVLTAVPWLAKRYAVIRLHEIRDSLYLLADAVPTASNSDLYRDLEFLINSAIGIVRERSVNDALQLVLALVPRKHGDTVEEVDSASYESLLTSADSKAAVGDVVRQFQRIPQVVLWRILWSNPVCIVVGLAIVAYVAVSPRPRATADVAHRIRESAVRVRANVGDLQAA